MENKIFQTIGVLMVLAISAIMISCDPNQEDPHEVNDPEARLYRMYIDNGKGELALKKFNGRIQLADIESKFGPLEQLPQDSLGNYTMGWRHIDDMFWSLIAGPNFNSINLTSMDKEGTISSVIDLDGDRIAEIVDIRLEDRTRFTFADELRGMVFLEFWLLNQNPFCNDQHIPGIDYPIMNCDEGSSGSSSGLKGSGIIDFFEKLCEEKYGSQPSLDIGAVSHADGSPRFERQVHRGQVDGDSGNTYVTETKAFYDENGNISHIVRTRTEMDGDRVTRVVREVILGNGEGNRVTRDIGFDGTVKRKEETLEGVDLDEYIDEDPGGNNPPPATSSTPETTDPGPIDGPFGSESDLRIWCEATTPYESGVEQAATRDPAAFRVSCDDLVVSSTGGSDCTIVEWASPGDFNGVLDPPSTDSGCGPFEQPGEDGICGPVSGIQRLLGQTAEVVSANLGDIILCDPIVCNPGI